MHKVVFNLVFTLLFTTFIKGQNISFNKLEVLKFSSTECLNNSGRKIQQRLIKQELVNDTLLVEISVCTDCGSDKYGTAHEYGDTLHISSGYEIRKELDVNGNLNEYLIKGAECTCAYQYVYKIKTEKKYKVIKYDQNIMEYHKNHLRDEIKVVGNDTVRLGETCSSLYEFRTDEYLIFYEFYSTGEMKGMVQYNNQSPFGQYMTLFDRKGNKIAVIWRNSDSDTVHVIDWENNKISMNTYNNHDEINGAKYYEYLQNFF